MHFVRTAQLLHVWRKGGEQAVAVLLDALAVVAHAGLRVENAPHPVDLAESVEGRRDAADNLAEHRVVANVIGLDVKRGRPLAAEVHQRSESRALCIDQVLLLDRHHGWKRGTVRWLRLLRAVLREATPQRHVLFAARVFAD